MTTEYIDTRAFLKAAGARLKPSGYLYLTTPEAAFWVERGLFQRDAAPLQHLVANSPDTLLFAADYAGLEAVVLEPSAERHIVAVFRKKAEQ